MKTTIDVPRFFVCTRAAYLGTLTVSKFPSSMVLRTSVKYGSTDKRRDISPISIQSKLGLNDIRLVYNNIVKLNRMSEL